MYRFKTCRPTRSLFAAQACQFAHPDQAQPNHGCWTPARHRGQNSAPAGTDRAGCHRLGTPTPAPDPRARHAGRLGLHRQIAMAADASQTKTWWDGQPLTPSCWTPLQRLRHRAPPSGRALAAPRHRHRRLARTKTPSSTLQGPAQPGGHLLYCTCSVFREEGQQRVDAFCNEHPKPSAVQHPATHCLWSNMTSHRI